MKKLILALLLVGHAEAALDCTYSRGTTLPGTWPKNNSAPTTDPHRKLTYDEINCFKTWLDGLMADLNATELRLNDAIAAISGGTSTGAATCSGISPASGPVLTTNVTLTGTNFVNVTDVRFGALSSATRSVDSTISATATVPEATVGTVDVKIYTVASPSGVSCGDFTVTTSTYVSAIPNVGMSVAAGGTFDLTGHAEITCNPNCTGLSTTPDWSVVTENCGSVSGQTYTAPATAPSNGVCGIQACAPGSTVCSTGGITIIPATTVAGLPAFSPASGSYATTQTVSIASATTGATICYTTDGSTPAGSGGTCTAGTPLSNGATISVASTETVKAIATQAGYNTSLVASASYTIGTATVAAAPTFSPVGGTYGVAQTVTLATTTSGATICYTTNGTTPAANTPGTCSTGSTYAAPISVNATQTIKALATKAALTNSAVVEATYTVPTQSVVEIYDHKDVMPTVASATGTVTGLGLAGSGADVVVILTPRGTSISDTAGLTWTSRVTDGAGRHAWVASYTGAARTTDVTVTYSDSTHYVYVTGISLRYADPAYVTNGGMIDWASAQTSVSNTQTLNATYPAFLLSWYRTYTNVTPTAGASTTLTHSHVVGAPLNESTFVIANTTAGTGSKTVSATFSASDVEGMWIEIRGSSSGGGSPTSYALTTATSPNGTGTISCNGGACAGTYNAGTLLTVTAAPNAGYAFAGWSGDCSGSSCTLTMNGAHTVTANFTQTGSVCATNQQIIDDMTVAGLATHNGWNPSAYIETGVHVPSWADSIKMWGQIDIGAAGAGATNTSVEVRNPAIYIKQTSGSPWVKLQQTTDASSGGSAGQCYDEQFSGGPVSCYGDGYCCNRQEPDGGTSMRIPTGYVYHFWPTGAGWASIPGRTAGSTTTLYAIYTEFEARLIKYNASGTDDTGTANYVGQSAADYYYHTGSPCCSQAVGPTGENGEIGMGRHKKLTTSYQWFSFFVGPTMPYFTDGPHATPTLTQVQNDVASTQPPLNCAN